MVIGEKPTNKKVELAKKININIIDIKGSHIKQLAKSNKEAGEHLAQWDGTNDLGSYVSAGVYFFTIETESEYRARKMVLLK